MVARRLHDLTKKNRPFIRGQSQERAFTQLKELSAPILAYLVTGVKFILDTDASTEGLGSVLSQQIDGNEKNENKGGVAICWTIVETNGSFSKEDIGSAQMADEDLNAILKALEKEKRPTWEEI
ncbi:uncharacterized protein LOC119642465 [Glossina fuscipes]|uniref:Uncharacterized protein LOC119642465 n=1 Tax=Glossina fuscipes TaxID=7396 RepID=A0A9C5ZBL8_9MUSC|nr:uncharacterized protein LOC119642465 [Glossina fuscipes]